MSLRPSFLARSLEPLVAALWILFVLISLLIATVWSLNIGESSLEKAVSNPDLRNALVWMLAHLDLGWITLAAANVYLSLVERMGLATARCWGLQILGSVVAVAWVSVVTSVPLGPIRYGAALGLKLGPVPLGLPLLWFSIIIGARETLLRFRPRIGHGLLGAGVGVLAFLTDLNLEPLVAKWRGFWFWRGGSTTLPPVFDPPLAGSLAWGVLAALITLILREREVVASAQKPSWQPMVVLGVFNAVFLGSHVAHRLSH
jgi:uncharacterized membrane protein